jgi:hypothetical protein
MPQQNSAVGVSIFRELAGDEEALIVAHDIEQAFIDMLATGEFKQKVIEWLEKTGRFGAGACYPVVYMQGILKFKVFASVESARSKEKMPAPFSVTVEAEAGERRPDTEQITEAEVTISRVIGTSTENAVDKARLEASIVPLVPVRTQDGAVVNAPGKHAQRKEDYDARFAKSKDTVLRKKAEAEAAAMTEAERERVVQESEARNIEPSSAPESGIK